jgi:hypothetical protein
MGAVINGKENARRQPTPSLDLNAATRGLKQQ